MAPSAAHDDSESAAVLELFKRLGLTQAQALEAKKNPKNAASLKELIEVHGLAEKSIENKQASLIASFATQGTTLGPDKRAYGLSAILDGRLKSTDQVSAAAKHLGAHPSPVNTSEFEKDCGVGKSCITITSEDIFERANQFVGSSTTADWSALGPTIGQIKALPELRWANPLELKTQVERVFTERFGPKQSAGKGKTKALKNDAVSDLSSGSNLNTFFTEGFLSRLHRPGENPQVNPELKQAHLEATNGGVWTRFPPEPNGFLHIGHSKAIMVDFGYAAHHKGKCYLRFDDTNPAAEEQRYIDNIIETVKWLGFTPWRITYSSDYFQELYDLAVTLVKKDKGYVCHCTGEEIHADRGGDNFGPRKACIHRSRPIHESLREFEKMKAGLYKPGEATLRMKQDLESGNPQMWDLIAYRNVDAPHHRTGNTWKIYPTYDFTHCLVDSLENISHSLCTTEFVASRESYEWLCDALEVYKPRQYEFGRLSIQGTITSKRKLLALVVEGHVSGWDDPRLYTLIALRRRGVPPGAILSFVGGLGVSTAISSIQTVRFEQALRQYLENSVPRLMMVLRPIKITLENLDDDFLYMIEKPLHPKVPELGKSVVPLTRHIYIDADDFRVTDSPDYFRLAPGKSVGLFQAPWSITCVSFKTDPSSGAVMELICRAETDEPAIRQKPKAFIHWVAEHPASGSPVLVDEVRVFHPLFKSDNPAGSKDFREDINPLSLEVYKGAKLELGFRELMDNILDRKAVTEESAQFLGPESVRFQALRTGYFALDKDSVRSHDPKEKETIILNRIVSLKEDLGKF